jgi:hypothetical protein
MNREVAIRPIKIPVAIVCCLAGILLSVPAHAGGWGAAITSEALATYLPPSASRVLVVTAGDADPALSELRKVIVARVNAIDGKAAVTISSLNETEDEDDALLRKARRIESDATLIVRLFSPAEGSATAVGTVYGPKDAVFGAFALEQGDRLEPRPADTGGARSGREPSEATSDEASEPGDEDAKRSASETGESDQPAPSEGVRQETSDAVASIGADDDDSYAPSRSERYKENVLTVSETRIHNVDTGKTTSRLYFYRGVYKQALTPEEFLRELGREDLIETFDQRKAMKRGGIILSALTTAAGATVATVALIKNENCNIDPSRECVDQFPANRTAAIAGGIIGSVGAIGLVAFIGIKPFPLNGSEARKLAYDYNESLDESDDDGEDRDREPSREQEAEKRDLSWKPSAPSIDVGAGAVGRGAGLILRGRF